jgi:hypothetical protein
MGHRKARHAARPEWDKRGVFVGAFGAASSFLGAIFGGLALLPQGVQVVLVLLLTLYVAPPSSTSASGPWPSPTPSSGAPTVAMPTPRAIRTTTVSLTAPPARRHTNSQRPPSSSGLPAAGPSASAKPLQTTSPMIAAPQQARTAPASAAPPPPVRAYDFHAQETTGQPDGYYSLAPRQYVYQPFRSPGFDYFAGVDFVAYCVVGPCIVQVYLYTLPNGAGFICASKSFGLAQGWNSYRPTRGTCATNHSDQLLYAQVYMVEGSSKIGLVDNAGHDGNLNAVAPTGQPQVPANSSFDAILWLQK